MFERLGLSLRTFRELSGKSQASVAREAGIGKSQLSKYAWKSSRAGAMGVLRRPVVSWIFDTRLLRRRPA